MNVWIVNPYGTLPSEGWREYRSAMLARALSAKGHQVLWWISDIEHRAKARRPLELVDPDLPSSVTVKIVHTRAYNRNISMGRVLYERSFGAGFAAASQSLAEPDLVVLADPSLFFAKPVVNYANRRNIPLVLDVLDLWPEMFHLVLPVQMRRLGSMIFAPLYRRRDRLVAQAAAVVAVTGDYLAEVTRRVTPRRSAVAYLGVDTAAFAPPVLTRREHEPIDVVYAGTLGDAYDMLAVLAAIETLASAEHGFRFTIAGDGPWHQHVATLANRFPEKVRFLGSVFANELPDIYCGAQIGLATYAAGSTVSMPVKLFDYMAAGLATVGSMGGEACEMLSKGAGRPYQAGSTCDLIAALEFYRNHPASLAQARRFAFESAKEFDQAHQHERFAILLGKIGNRGQ